MNKEQSKEKFIALLIDADNISSYHVNVIIDEVSLYGIPSIKRIYADWTRPTMVGWKEKLLNFAISPIQQFSYTAKKNATDSALIIDAMDILYSNNIDIFFIVSSDSDFTKLALRLREAGKMVCGIGDEKTPQPFVVACNRFFYLSALEKIHRLPSDFESNTAGGKKTVAKVVSSGKNTISETVEPNNDLPKEYAKNTTKAMSLERFQSFLIDCINDISDDDGWVNLANLGNYLHNKRSDFDPRNYGHRKLHNLIKSFDEFILDVRISREDPNVKHIYVRIKD